ncbi:hypothetical protein OT109_04435 [Phycisphaeraceae bacterium D3-23]
MSDASPATHSTLGQRIDALLGPLETEAHQYREAIELGRQQVSQLQGKVALAEEALAGIEQKMGQILDTLTQEEPMLASAVGRCAQAVPTPAVTPLPSLNSTPEAVVDTPTMLPAAEPAPPVAYVSSIESPEPPSPAPDAMDSFEAESAKTAPQPTAEEDATAVDEIMQMLSVDPDEFATVPAGPLADAAAQAELAAQQLGGSMPGNDSVG